jgi:hypothetical protein
MELEEAEATSDCAGETSRNLTDRFPTANLIENDKRYNEIYSIHLPICTISTASVTMTDE